MPAMSKMDKETTLTNWVNDYADDLYSWAFHKTSDESVAQDLVQETFLSAFKGLEKFNRGSQPKTWLSKILNNKIIDYYRKKARQLDINRPLEGWELDQPQSFFDRNNAWQPNGLEPAWEEDPHLLDDVAFQKTMEKCLIELPEKWRFVISSKYLLEKKAQEICQEIDISPSNYWQILHRSKLALKKCLETNWFSEMK